MFAPTNAAFQALEANLGYTPEQLLSSSILAPTLKYHVVPGVAAEVIKQAKMLLSDLSLNIDPHMTNTAFYAASTCTSTEARIQVGGCPADATSCICRYHRLACIAVTRKGLLCLNLCDLLSAVTKPGRQPDPVNPAAWPGPDCVPEGPRPRCYQWRADCGQRHSG